MIGLWVMLDDLPPTGFWQPDSGTDEAAVPGDGGIAWVNREDLGEATAKLIAAVCNPNYSSR
jgi:hypothetical protein